MSELVAINVRYMGENAIDLSLNPDIFQLPYETTWMDLEAMMKAQFDSDDVQICYIDIDEDPITISCQSELNEAFKVAAASNNVLRLQVKDLTFREGDPTEVPGSVEPISIPLSPDKTDMPSKEDDEATKLTDTEVTTTQESEPLKPVLVVESPVVATNVVVAEIPVIATTVVVAESPVVVTTVDEKRDEVSAEETGENPPKDLLQDAETGTFSKHLPRKRSKRLDSYTRVAFERGGEAKRQSKSADRAVLGRKSRSGDTTRDDNSVPYPKFVEFLEQLKHDLRSEIVRDVTRKTVKQVLKGLDGAVIQSVHGTSGVSPPTSMSSTSLPTTISTHPIYYHCGVICGHCQRNIVGSRYKCGNCSNFDLCEECESLYSVHDLDHVFVKLRYPVKACKTVDGHQIPLLDGLLYKPGEVELAAEQLSLETINRKMARKEEKLKKKEEKLVEKQKKKEEKLKRRLETNRDLPYKREKLDLPSAERSIHVSILMKAEFLYDVTIPDYSQVQPGTKMQKTWRMKNVGSVTWSDVTQLRLLSGNIMVTKTEVPVPHLHPGEEGDITAELTAPNEPGRYHSHWKMFDAGMEFGHHVWCAIIVVPKELLEPVQDERLKVVLEESEPPKNEDQGQSEDTSNVNIEVNTPLKLEPLVTVESDNEKGDNSEPESAVNKVELDLTTAAAAVAQLKLEQKPVAEVPGGELTSFEMLDLRERIPPKVSQTATPTNTPLDVTPPKSPTPEPQERLLSPLSSSSSVEIVSGEHDDDLAQMTEYVQECMAGLGLKPEIDVDMESLSSFSEDDDDDDDSSLGDDDDFFIVPLPDCFDPSKPMIQSVVDVSNDEQIDSNHNNITSTCTRPIYHSVSQEEIPARPSCSISVPFLIPTSIPIVKATGSLKSVADVSQISATDVASLSVEPADQVISTEGSSRPTDQQEIQEVGSESKSIVTNAETRGAGISEPRSGIEQTTEPSDAAAEQQGETTTTEENGEASEGPCEKNRRDSSPPNPSEFANQIMATAVNAATRAATHAFATAKGVFYTLQAKHTNPQGEFKQPQSNWKPSEKKWKPPQEKWSTPKNDWIPPKADNALQKKDSSAMGRLVEMGFCDRNLNNQLLEMHEDNLDLVIQELLQRIDNDWAEKRH